MELRIRCLWRPRPPPIISFQALFIHSIIILIIIID